MERSANEVRTKYELWGGVPIGCNAILQGAKDIHVKYLRIVSFWFKVKAKTSGGSCKCKRP